MTPAPMEFAPWNGVFETVRVIDGVPIFMQEHQGELARAMSALGLVSDFSFDQDRKNLPRLSGRWRWIVTPERTHTHFIPEELSQVEPIELSVSPVRVGSCNWDARFKTLSYLSHAQAWKIKSTDEVILLNEHGLVASAARANLFWQLDGQLFTPAHEAGCRQGVMRSFVCQNRDVKSGHYPPTDLLKSEEVFVTNSLKGIVSVRAIKGHAYESFGIADELRAAYAEEVARQVAAERAVHDFS